MFRGLLGWQYELGGDGRCCLVWCALGYFISGLVVIGCVPLLSGVMFRICPFPFFVPLFDHLSSVFVCLLLLSGSVICVRFL